MQLATKTRAVTRTRITVLVGLLAITTAAAGYLLLMRNVSPTFSLSASSPSGVGFPSPFIPVMAYQVTASQNSSATINDILFQVVSTDVAGSQWNICSNMAGANKWAILDGSGTQIQSAAGWTFYNSAMVPCANGDVLAYIRGTMAGGGITIQAGNTAEFSLWGYTVGASQASDDTLRVDIVGGQNSVTWTDDRGIQRRSANNLPVIGGTTTY